MKYININISYYFSSYLACFASLAELYCSTCFLFAPLLNTLIRKASTEMNGIYIECNFLIMNEQIKFDMQVNYLHWQVSHLLPCCLWKQQHHSLLDIKLSLYVSQELKNAFVHCSFLSRQMLPSSDWSSSRSQFVSSLLNIQPSESLQIGKILVSNPNGKDRK